ncbi:MAG: hypothetical protein E6Q50_17655 [Lysobacter sp.]|nr:MAG: hypothetical protein E6Q50_17655 [Lysobacter sp.]
MAEIPGFWDVGPHEPLDVEAAWKNFVCSIGGSSLDKELEFPRSFENADFYFPESCIVAELKEIKTDFANAVLFNQKHNALLSRLFRNNPEWRPSLLGGDGSYPEWFLQEYIRLFRPHLQRILKKANSQIRETKKHFEVYTNTGVLLLVNDDFISIGPGLIRAMVSDILLHNYSSIDCCVYLTVNRYVELPGSNVPRLLWAPAYSDRAPDYLANLINALGAKWFRYLETLIGTFSQSDVDSSDGSWLMQTRAIVIPSPAEC